MSCNGSEITNFRQTGIPAGSPSPTTLNVRFFNRQLPLWFESFFRRWQAPFGQTCKVESVGFRYKADRYPKARGLKAADFLFPSRLHTSPHLSTRQYARMVHRWIASIGLDDTAYGTHTMRRTKASLIYRRTKNLRAVQLLLGHTKLESTVRYLGIEVDDALEMAEQTEV